jgi:beta-glucuronidase
MRKAFALGVVAVALVAGSHTILAETAGSNLPLATVENEPLLVSADMRDGQDLSGTWNWSIDPYRSGISGFHGETPDRGQQRWLDIDVRKTMAQDNRTMFEFDMAHAQTTSLPGSWLAASPELRHYQGLVWYQRHFDAPAARKGRYFLRFGAANYATTVYINGQPLGRHEGGFTPFAFEVTKQLRDGDNQITFAVDSQATATTVPPTVTDWENYGGATRGIRLVHTPDTYVDSAWVRLTKDGKLAVDAHLDGAAAAGQAVRLKVAGLPVDLTGKTDAHGDWKATMSAPRALVRWSPEKPQLYDVSLSAGEDEWHDRVGFRTIERKGADILLNGKPVFLRGISMHEEEISPNPARIITPDNARALLGEIKHGLHGNYVRLSHYPHSEVMTRVADELGLLVWSEVPVYWMVAWDNAGTLASARNMLAENILRDRNRASVVIWSVANETPVNDARNAFLRTLVSDVRRLDPTRLVSAALLVERDKAAKVPTMTMADPLAADLDVLSINTYNGWYTPDRLAELPGSVWNVPADKPLVFSEFGADAKAGFHSPTHLQKFSEEFQAEYYRQTLAMADRVPTLRGMSPWILKDFRSPRRQNPDFQMGWNRKGLISETGQHKQAFDVLAGYYAAKAEGKGK